MNSHSLSQNISFAVILLICPTVSVALDGPSGPDLHQRDHPAPPKGQTPEERQKLIGRALAYHARSAATREGSSRVMYPAPDSAVLPDRFVIRWKPTPQPGKLTFRILAGEESVWTGEADSTARSLDSAGARQALLAYRDRSEKNSNALSLQWSTGEAGGSVPFTLLSAAEERSLNQELEFWDHQSNELFRFIGRAYSFGKRKLYSEAAQENEAALKLAPDKCDRLLETKTTEENAGNMARVRELNTAIENVPGGCPDTSH